MAVLSLPVFLGRGGGKAHRLAAGAQGWAEGRAPPDGCGGVGLLGWFGFFFYFFIFPLHVFMSAYRLHAMCVHARLRFLCLSVSGDDMKNKG